MVKFLGFKKFIIKNNMATTNVAKYSVSCKANSLIRLVFATSFDFCPILLFVVKFLGFKGFIFQKNITTTNAANYSLSCKATNLVRLGCLPL